ncbi:MAG: uroporphyrinogen-III synthase [Tannerellaceae bacterium]|nr:uroporphyrinogen-III synthase [Tannerellaceae bacterium]
MENKHIYILSTGKIREKYLQEAQQKGFFIDIDPFISVNLCNQQSIRDRIQKLSRENITAIFTSQYAVRSVIKMSDHVPAWKIYCLEGATQKEISSFWGTENIIATAGNGKELATQILSAANKERYIFFCGNRRMDTIPSSLLAYDLFLEELVVYDTILLPHTINRTYDAIFFFSPSAVESFFSVNYAEPTLFFLLEPR